MTQEGLAAQLGVGQGAVSKWETGKAEPPASLLPSIALVVRARVDDLLEHVNPRYDRASKGQPALPFTPETAEQVAARELVELWLRKGREVQEAVKSILKSAHDAPGIGHPTSGATPPADPPAGAEIDRTRRKRAR